MKFSVKCTIHFNIARNFVVDIVGVVVAGHIRIVLLVVAEEVTGQEMEPELLEPDTVEEVLAHRVEEVQQLEEVLQKIAGCRQQRLVEMDQAYLHILASSGTRKHH
jgi:hypothetical protein